MVKIKGAPLNSSHRRQKEERHRQRKETTQMFPGNKLLESRQDQWLRPGKPQAGRKEKEEPRSLGGKPRNEKKGEPGQDHPQ